MVRTPNDPNKKKVTAAMLQSLIDDLSAKREIENQAAKDKNWKTLATYVTEKPTLELSKGNENV